MLLDQWLHRAIRAALAAPRISHAGSPGDLGLKFEALRIATANQRTLHAWLVAPPDSSVPPHPAAIVIHGWGGNSAMMLPLARPLHEAGVATLFIDSRCHGASDDDDFASLPRFAEDIESALDNLRARAEIDAKRVALIGHSVGAAAVILAASRRAEVAAVVSVAAFSHPAAVMKRWLAAKHIPERPVGRYILEYVQQAIGSRFDDIAPVNTIGQVQCPVLLVHGADDCVVPLEEARQVFARRAHEAVELRVVDGGHDAFADLPQNLELLRTFLQDRLIGVRAMARTGIAAGLASSESNAAAGGAAAQQRRSK